MSRLFGFFGNEPANLFFTTKDIEKENRKSDGWGVGFYKNNASFLFKKATNLSGEQRMTSVSEVISSKVFISHVRYASIGERKESNTQPFRWGNWLFAHQGTISNFRKVKSRLLRKLPTAYKKMIKGNTDSEHCFYLFLTMLREKGAVKKGDISLEDASAGLIEFADMMKELCEEAEVDAPPKLNFILSNGVYLIAARYGDPLYYVKRTLNEGYDTVLESKETGVQVEIKFTEPETDIYLISTELTSSDFDWIEISDGKFLMISPDRAESISTWYS